MIVFSDAPERQSTTYSAHTPQPALQQTTPSVGDTFVTLDAPPATFFEQTPVGVSTVHETPRLPLAYNAPLSIAPHIDTDAVQYRTTPMLHDKQYAFFLLEEPGQPEREFVQLFHNSYAAVGFKESATAKPVCRMLAVSCMERGYATIRFRVREMMPITEVIFPCKHLKFHITRTALDVFNHNTKIAAQWHRIANGVAVKIDKRHVADCEFHLLENGTYEIAVKFRMEVMMNPSLSKRYFGALAPQLLGAINSPDVNYISIPSARPADPCVIQPRGRGLYTRLEWTSDGPTVVWSLSSQGILREPYTSDEDAPADVMVELRVFYNSLPATRVAERLGLTVNNTVVRRLNFATGEMEPVLVYPANIRLFVNVLHIVVSDTDNTIMSMLKLLRLEPHEGRGMLANPGYFGKVMDIIVQFDATRSFVLPIEAFEFVAASKASPLRTVFGKIGIIEEARLVTLTVSYFYIAQLLGGFGENWVF